MGAASVPELRSVSVPVKASPRASRSVSPGARGAALARSRVRQGLARVPGLASSPAALRGGPD